MEYITLMQVAPAALLWIAPLLVLGFTIFVVLVLFAWLHDVRTTSDPQ